MNRMIFVALSVPIGTAMAVVGCRPVSTDFRFATSVALFGMLMRGTPTKAPVSYQTALALAESAINNDPERLSLVGLIRTAGVLAR